MGKNKKKYIDKRKAATFALVYRESADGEEVGSERVYTRIDNNEDIHPAGFEDDARFEDAEEDDEAIEELEPKLVMDRIKQEVQKELPEHVKKELLEMGFPDDGYNYMKHMRTIGASGGTLFVPTTSQQINSLPADVKAYDASRVRVQASENSQEDVFSGQKDFASTQSVRMIHVPSKEVAALLEESDVSDGEDDGLEDDFVLIANKDVEGEFSKQEDIPRESDEDAEEYIHEPVSTIREEVRPLRILDEQFEVLTRKEYDSDDFGDDDPRARGTADISEYGDILDEFLAQNPGLYGKPFQKPEKCHPKHGTPSEEEFVNVEAVATENINNEVVDEEVEGSSEEVEEVYLEEGDEERETWDCETIVSTMSNLDNHPARISTPGVKRVRFASIQQQQNVIRLSGKQKLPVDFINKSFTQLEKSHVKKVAPVEDSLQRKRGEGREERKSRKAAVKEERRASRKAKKELKTQFKSESQKAQVGAAVSAPKAIHLS